MLLEKIAVSKGKSIFFTRERKFFRGRGGGVEMLKLPMETIFS